MRKISIYLLKLFFTRDKDFVPLAEVPVEGFASSFKNAGAWERVRSTESCTVFSHSNLSVGFPYCRQLRHLWRKNNVC